MDDNFIALLIGEKKTALIKYSYNRNIPSVS